MLRTSERGFTLIELIVVIGVIGILSAIAYPNFVEYQRRRRINDDARSLVHNFNLARSEAGNRNKQVAVTFLQPLAGVVYSYIVYVDDNSNYKYDAGESVLSKINLSDGVSFDAAQGGGDGLSFIDNTDGLPTLAWNSRGQSRGVGNALGGGTAYLLNDFNTKRDVVISMAGRIRIQ